MHVVVKVKMAIIHGMILVRLHLYQVLENYQALLRWIFHWANFYGKRQHFELHWHFEIALQKINSSLPKTVKWHRVSNCSFKLCTERALKAICFSLQFYYLEVLNQDGTPSRATAMTPSFCQGVICQDWSCGLDDKSGQLQTKDSHIS